MLSSFLLVERGEEKREKHTGESRKDSPPMAIAVIADRAAN